MFDVNVFRLSKISGWEQQYEIIKILTQKAKKSTHLQYYFSSLLGKEDPSVIS